MHLQHVKPIIMFKFINNSVILVYGRGFQRGGNSEVGTRELLGQLGPQVGRLKLLE